MDALKFFLDGHRGFHSKLQQALDLFTEEQIRWRPPDGGNSIAWHAWHIARTEDAGISRLLMDRRQVLDEQEWLPRLNVSHREMGAGMTSEEVTALSANIDVTALRGYLAAVPGRTQEVAQSIDPSLLDEVNNPDHVRRVLFEEGVVHPNAAWVEEVCQGQPKATFLRHWALTHSYGHYYEIMAMRKHFGIQGR